MKLFNKLDKEALQASWATKDDPALSIYGGMNPAFTPAIQGQDNGLQPFGGIAHYSSLHNVLSTHEYTGWQDECRAISETGYIGDWSWLRKVRITGPDAIKCLEQGTINSYKRFPIGRARHIVSITPEGKLIGDGIAFREADDKVLCTAGATLFDGQMFNSEGCDVEVEDITAELFNYHVQGPVSREVLEKATGEGLGDLGFLQFRDSMIAGRTVRVYRGGMSGELGYELFGDSEDGSVVWSAVYEAGKAMGLRQLGMRSLMVNHLQAYFPTIWVDYVPGNIPGAEALHRSPVDFGWAGLMDKERNFPGKDALVAEMANPRTKCVTLELNTEDCMVVYNSLFDANEEAFEQMPMPVNTSDYSASTPQFVPAFSTDNQMVGMVSNRGYSCQFKKFLALADLPIELCEEGTEVMVLHGSEGKRQIMIRAKVARTPYKQDKRH